MTRAVETKPAPALGAPAWTTEDARALYALDAWGQGHFDIDGRGDLLLLPERDPARSINLPALVAGIAERGLHTPLLLRFSDLLRHRMRELHGAFAEAIEAEAYEGGYRCDLPDQGEPAADGRRGGCATSATSSASGSRRGRSPS